jgi:hypothetical protein
MTRPRATLALGMLAALIVAGCGGAATPKPTASASATPAVSAGTSAAATGDASAAPDACRLLTPEIAATFAGRRVRDPEASDRGDVASCVYGSVEGGPTTVGVTIAYAIASSTALAELSKQVPESEPASGLDNVLVAPGAGWFILDRHLVSVVLVGPDGTPGSPSRIRDLILAIHPEG